MRAARINDIWRYVNDTEQYRTRIRKVEIKKLSGFEDITIEPQSAITAICGKNGVGKTTFLKLIYQAIKSPKKQLCPSRFGVYDFQIEILDNRSNIIFNRNSEHHLENVYYLEPSQECARILDYIKRTTNINELIEGEGENISFNDDKTKPQIESIIGKKYKKIVFREITGAIENDYTFPYFEIELASGAKYSNIDMGMGEFAVFYILWFIKNCERNSIIFIEEPENFISANTQIYLMDKIAEQSNSNKLWIMLSTHSEHILSKISVENTKVLQKRLTDITHLIEPKHREKYLSALGLVPQLDGIIFVEDNFSANFTNYLLSKLAPAFLKSYRILPIRCDSNIEKIALHYEPLRKSPINYIGILDADQKAKVVQYLDKDIYISSLPGSVTAPPETIVWDVLVDNSNNISDALDVDHDTMQNVIMENSTADYHDRYTNISKELSIPLDVLLQKIFSSWINMQENRKLAEDFVFAIINYNKRYTSLVELQPDNKVKLIADDKTILLKRDDIYFPQNRAKPLVNGMELKFNLFFKSYSFIAKVTAE